MFTSKVLFAALKMMADINSSLFNYPCFYFFKPLNIYNTITRVTCLFCLIECSREEQRFVIQFLWSKSVETSEIDRIIIVQYIWQ
jgi:hypothetical protein